MYLVPQVHAGGSQPDNLVLSFDGAALRGNGIDGPFSIRDLALYGKAYQAYRNFTSQNKDGAISCDAVSRAILHALTARRPRTRYLVGKDAVLFSRLAQVCPARVVDWVTRKVMGLGAVSSS